MRFWKKINIYIIKYFYTDRWWWSNTGFPQSLKILERNKPWKVLKNHWLGSLKILEGEKYTASFIWNRRSLNLLENLGSPGKVIEFHIKLRVGTLAINFIPQKIHGLSRKVHTPSQSFLAQQRRKLLVRLHKQNQAFLPYSFEDSRGGGGGGGIKRRNYFIGKERGAIKEVASLCRSWWIPEEYSCFDQIP